MSEVPGRRDVVRRLLASATLVCGAEMDTLLEQVADGYAATPSEHQRECVYCQAALEQLTLMWAPIAEMVATSAPAPPELAAAVTGRLQTAVHDVWCLSVTDLGSVHIAARAVTAVASDAARRVSGVRAVFARSTRTSDAAQQSAFERGPARYPPDVMEAAVAVDLAVTVSDSESVDEVARDVQQRVIAALRDRLGMRATAIKVAVDQVDDS